MPPLAIEYDVIGLLAMSGIYGIVGALMAGVYIVTAISSGREDHARTLGTPTWWAYVDPGLLAYGIACWLLVGFMVWFLLGLVYCGVSLNPECNPMDHFPLRFVAVE